MNRTKINRFWPTVLGSLALLSGNEAFAYIDPGTGSLLIQWAFGAAIAGFAIMNVYWERAKAFFSRKADTTTTGQQTEKAADEAGSD